MAGFGEALGGILGGVLGNNAAKMDNRKAKEMMQEAMKVFKDLGVAPDLSKALVLQQLQEAGTLTPELEKELDLAASEFENIKEDSSLRDTQLEALNKFRQSAETGMGAEEKAAYNQMQQGVRQDVRAKQDQILQDAQRRGQGGGGAELIAQLNASQAGADAASENADNLSAMIAQRVRQGAQDMSSAAGGLRDQDYKVASDKASALDARNQFMYTNSMGRQARNTATLNNAEASNLANKQRVQDANAIQANDELRRQNEAKFNQYNQNLNRASGMSGAATGASQFYQNQANTKAQGQRDMMTGIGGMVDGGVKEAGGIAGIASMFSDKKLKTDVEYNDEDIESFLDSITPASYNYKDSVKNDPRASKDRQLGVMAQDLEKSELGDEAVNETEDGKIVNYKDLQPKMLAALAHLNKKLKKFEGQE